MTVTRLFYNEKEQEVAQLSTENGNATLEQMMRCGWYCNNVKQIQKEEEDPKFVGEQTELAIFKLAYTHFQGKQNCDFVRCLIKQHRNYIQRATHMYIYIYIYIYIYTWQMKKYKP